MEKANSKFRPVVIRLKIDFLSHLARCEGAGYMHSDEVK